MSTNTDAQNRALPTEMSDKFGPMLVKELRQGLRTKVFLTAFIGFQAILLVMVLSAFASAGNTYRSADFLNASIWAVLTIMLVVITPLRGQFALEKEIRTGTLELLQITHLDAWHIVRGKWSALMGEAMLYLAAALPYFTLRYFLGGVNILSDLGWLALIALLSGTLTAVVVGLSGFRSVLLRIGIAIGIVMLVPLTMQIMEEMVYSYRGGFSPFTGSTFSDWWELFTGMIIAMLVIGWSFLRLGARTIATQAENHSTGVRLATLFGLAAMLLLDRMADSPSTVPTVREGTPFLFCFFSFGVFTCGLFIAITDNSLQSTRVYAPFIRRRITPLGRLLLYPGWGAAFLYVMIISAMLMLVRLMKEEPEEILLSALLIFNVLMLPAAVTRTMMRMKGVRYFQLSTYITVLVGIGIASAVLLLAETWVTDDEPVITMLFPIPALAGADMNKEELAIALQAVSAFLTSGLLLIMAVDDIGFTRRRELATRALLAKRELESRQEEANETEAPAAVVSSAGHEGDPAESAEVEPPEIEPEQEERS